MDFDLKNTIKKLIKKNWINHIQFEMSFKKMRRKMVFEVRSILFNEIRASTRSIFPSSHARWRIVSWIFNSIKFHKFSINSKLN